MGLNFCTAYTDAKRKETLVIYISFIYMGKLVGSWLYSVCSLWPLLVFVIVFLVIFVLYCSLVVIVIFVLLYLDLGSLFVLRLIAFVCYFLIVLVSFVICVVHSAKATDCLLFKRTVSVGFSHLKFTDYLVGHGAPKYKL